MGKLNNIAFYVGIAAYAIMFLAAAGLVWVGLLAPEAVFLAKVLAGAGATALAIGLTALFVGVMTER